MNTKVLTTIIALTFIILAHPSSARDLNCDPTALTFDREECTASTKTSIIKSKSVKPVSKNNTKSKSAFDAAASYDTKLKKLDNLRRAKSNTDEEYGMYIATSTSQDYKKKPAKASSNQTLRNTQFKGEYLYPDKSHKKNFDQLGIGAKIPLKSK